MVSNLLLIGRILLISILPAFLLIIAGTDEFDYIFDGLIIKGVSLGQKKLTALIIGVALSAGLVPIENIWFRKRVRRLEGFFHDEIVRDLKEVYDHLLKGLLNADFQSTSYRLFLPKKTLRYYLPLRFGKQIVYKYHTLSGFHHDEIKPLEFTVFPNYKAQGLIGKSFSERGISMRDGESNFEEYKEFYDRMTDYQKMVAKDHKFVMTIPVIDEKSAIVAILSVDSKKMLGLKEPPDKVFYALLAFSMDIYNIYQNIYKK